LFTITPGTSNNIFVILRDLHQIKPYLFYIESAGFIFFLLLCAHHWTQACNNKCLSVSEPCNGACAAGTTVCGPRCLAPPAQPLFHACGPAECLALGTPCNGTCPTNTTKCGADKCLTSGNRENEVYYDCKA
jgi:hypothetical protein